MTSSSFPVLCDLDGVIWLSHHPIAGSVEAVATLRERGHRVLFVTNNSASIRSEQERALAEIGIPANGDVLTSAMAAATLVSPGERILVCGGPGIDEAVRERGGIPVTDGDADAVMVGFHRTFDYERLRIAARAVERGARLIGTNDDATYPTPDGPIPGGGAILAAVATATGQVPTIAGKPYEPMAALVRELVGLTDMELAVMVGDRPETDGLFAKTLGCRFALVRSGVVPPGATVSPQPDIDADDLIAIVRSLLSPRTR
jgi:HAD superfamily hydrolase (TIGR01450 family)